MVSVASWVAVGEDEAAWHVLEGIGLPDGLEEEDWQVYWMGLWTDTVLDQRWEGGVTLVIIRIEVLAVPTGGEDDLSTDTVYAICIQIVFVA